MNEYKCPLCGNVLKFQTGNQTHPNDPNFGATAYCDASGCPSHENVYGHGKNEKEAALTAIEKFSKK